MSEKQPISYCQIGVSFIRIGCTAFGGGLAALPILEAELVRKRKWITFSELTEFYALSQTVPGVIIVNTSALIAIHLRGRRAGILAAVVAALPAFLAILLIATLLQNMDDHPWVTAALQGIRPVMLAIIAAAAIRLGYQNSQTLYTALFTVLMLLGLLFHVVSPAIAILGTAMLGILLAMICPNWLQNRMRRAGIGKEGTE